MNRDEWYFNQDFFTMSRYNKIQDWMKPDSAKDLFLYKPRRNNLT